ncbi:MAG: site-specific integrase [Rickettsiales bacterium]|nr:site-specific integrase [Rickettsiales bacterium]
MNKEEIITGFVEDSYTIRMSASKKAKQIAKYFRQERADYEYTKDVFRKLREILDIRVTKKAKKLPYVPTEEEIKKYYEVVWKSKNLLHIIMIKTLLYTGVRVTELINIKLEDVDINNCQIKISNGKGNKDRIVPFPQNFKEVLGVHVQTMSKIKAKYLFESSWKKQYTDRGIRKILEKYTKEAGIDRSISPHKLRHFLFTWMKRQGIDDALIQPYSGHESRISLEIYSKLAINDAQEKYDAVISKFPI